MPRPDWLDQIEWLKPHRLSELNADRQLITHHPGFYAFTETPGPLQVGQVLYIGETGRKGGIRERVGVYLHRNPEKSTTRHSGAIWMHNHRLYEKSDQTLWLRWSLWEGSTSDRQAIETALMQYYQCWYNKRQMGSDSDFQVIDSAD
ncbi:MAG: hypothetical protein JXQ91_13425 [Vannielia sp.]|uniref:hypothetical protein n=1 Tax=Rhodobacterales TaxID=204455 RepID=UPI0020953426|nr:hypothetical protein [Oceanicola sp. 502str15]MCO6382884.1 hypothetical protein [Oceanicola sp. 502str15]